MDSLTQVVLGATVSVAVAGRRIGYRQAALLGAALGTLPDLDVLQQHGDPVSDFVLHRGWSHALPVHAAVTPLLGEVLIRLFRGFHGHRAAAWLTVFLCLTSHALLDAMTIYGTRLLWPFIDTPFGTGSIFIIDPLYTLPLLAATLYALAVPGRGAARFTAGALVLSGLYLGWSLAAQQIAAGKARTALAAAGITPERLLTTPMPFNTLLWRSIAVDGPVYYNLYQQVFGAESTARIHRHPRLAPGGPCIAEIPQGAVVAEFSRGYYRTLIDDKGLRIADLRMGATPGFVFDFRIAAPADTGISGWQAIPPQRVRTARAYKGDFTWLLEASLGSTAPRPAERASLVRQPVTGDTSRPASPLAAPVQNGPDCE